MEQTSNLALARAVVVGAMLLALVGCNPSGDVSAAASSRQSYEAQLREFIEKQHLATLAPLRRYPSEANWAFLDRASSARVRAQGQLGHSYPWSGDIVISDSAVVPDYRRCQEFGPFGIWRPRTEACPGEWLQYRGDQRATGVSWFRLNWSNRPQTLDAISLRISQALDSVRVMAVRDPLLGLVAFVQSGGGVEAYATTGARLWRNDRLGLGEIIDVVDLDGDGSFEVVYATHAVINPSYGSATAPGSLFILSASAGEVLWKHEFEGLEFGINRYRTTIASVDGAVSKSIFATMTYSSSLMRFDFQQGASRGRLTWRSDPLRYDSPDKAPLIVDLDGDGRSEVVVDSFGSIYAIDAATGAIKASIAYADAPTFGGFVAVRDLDGDGKPEVVSVSSSPYWKGYAVVSWSQGNFVLRQRHVWEQGLANGELSVKVLGALVPSSSGPSAGLVVTLSSQNGAELQYIDALTGAMAWRLPGHELLQRIASDDGRVFVATKVNDSAAVIRVSSTAADVLKMVSGAFWIDVPPDFRPSLRAQFSGSGGTGVMAGADGTVWITGADAAGAIQLQSIQALKYTAKLTAHRLGPQGRLLSDGRTAYLVGSEGRLERWFDHSPRSFAVPLIGDLDGRGKREIIVPFAGGLSRFNVDHGALSSGHEIFATTPPQEREAFQIPVLLNEDSTIRRWVVGFESAIGADRLRRQQISARSSTGQLKWSAPLAAGNWEASIGVVKGKDGEFDLSVRDSRSTTLLRGASGAPRWRRDELGECQRQMASTDWNGDGIGDLGIQAGPVSLIYDGATGAELWRQPMVGSYGAYSGFVLTLAGAPALVHHNSGGLSMVGRRGLIIDLQVDERKLESLPVVIGRRALTEGESVFQITGSGQLRVFNSEGALVASNKLDIPVATMTGAYVDDDNSVDLLIGTFNGDLIAVSGATLQVLWRVQLGAMVGPAVVTDLEGNGRGEIVVVTGDGVLHLIRE